MILKIYEDDGSLKKYPLKKELFYDKKYEKKVSYISSNSKEHTALNIIKSYYCNSKSILFDTTNKSILKTLENLNIQPFEKKESNPTIFDNKNFSFLYFTSGTTGFPVGALKTKENILSEIEALTQLLFKYNIKKVIVTVPFIHFYGFLLGLMYPLINNIDILLKEHFLPNDLLDVIEENSLIVTTPLYIKALNKITQTKDLNNALFLSSTAPLSSDIAKEFNQKFNANILQLFGSTETGGIAYKYNDETLWNPFKKVQTSVNAHNELKIKSPFISDILYENGFKQTKSELQTFDYVQMVNNKFSLLGRSSQILKVAGKRYSTVQIENILENHKDINKAVVVVNTQQEKLRGESLNITIESKKEFLVKEIQKILKNELSNIKFSIKLTIVDSIKTTAIGKKILLTI